eukprot:426627-Hanusia_phi.AAC.1
MAGIAVSSRASPVFHSISAPSATNSSMASASRPALALLLGIPPPPPPPPLSPLPPLPLLSLLFSSSSSFSPSRLLLPSFPFPPCPHYLQSLAPSSRIPRSNLYHVASPLSLSPSSSSALFPFLLLPLSLSPSPPSLPLLLSLLPSLTRDLQLAAHRAHALPPPPGRGAAEGGDEPSGEVQQGEFQLEEDGLDMPAAVCAAIPRVGDSDGEEKQRDVMEQDIKLVPCCSCCSSSYSIVTFSMPWRETGTSQAPNTACRPL